jgi:hypothetical protein
MRAATAASEALRSFMGLELHGGKKTIDRGVGTIGFDPKAPELAVLAGQHMIGRDDGVHPLDMPAIVLKAYGVEREQVCIGLPAASVFNPCRNRNAVRPVVVSLSGATSRGKCEDERSEDSHQYALHRKPILSAETQVAAPAMSE